MATFRAATRALRVTLGLIFFGVILTVILELYVAGIVSLGPRFVPSAFIALLIATSILVVGWRVLGSLDERRTRILTKRYSRRFVRRYIRPRARRYYSLLLIFLLAGLVIFLASMAFASGSRSKDADVALQSFNLKHVAEAGNGALESTLVEYERARRQLAKRWAVSNPSPPIDLYLFKDLEEYREFSGDDWSGGAASCQENNAAVFAPLEKAWSMFQSDFTSLTPRHEMLHAIWCQILGRESFYSIPLWFHEGMAGHFANEETALFNRGLNRWWVWISRGSLLRTAEFCVYEPRDNHTEIGLFYGASYEFIRSLEAKHGIENLDAVIDDIRDGKTFDDSLRDRLGGTCNELYAEWRESL